MTHIQHARDVVAECLGRGVEIIDDTLGPDYARKNPSLLAVVVTSLVHEQSQPARTNATAAIAAAIADLSK